MEVAGRENRQDKWIVRIDWMRLIVALGGVAVLVVSLYRPGALNLNYWLSNVFGTYVFLMGLKTKILGRNISLGWFYMFFSTMMLVAVNLVHLRFA